MSRRLKGLKPSSLAFALEVSKSGNYVVCFAEAIGAPQRAEECIQAESSSLVRDTAHQSFVFVGAREVSCEVIACAALWLLRLSPQRKARVLQHQLVL